jgi:hypothetical protein
VPYLLLASAGAICSELGLELWWMPHRTIRGMLQAQVIKIAVAFSWPVLLFGVAAMRMWNIPRVAGVSRS